jgi:radical SAM superfamily enzyme
MEHQVYRVFSDYLKERYGEKVYKLPIALPVTCPNRDGSITTSNLTSPKGYDILRVV